MAPASAKELELHRRLVDGDPMACAELYDWYAKDLIEDLAHRYDRIAAHDRDLVSSAVTDAVFDYVAHPARYRPGKKNLKGYLRMSAVGDLLNLWRKVPKPEQVGWIRSLDELIEREMCPVCDVTGHLQDLDVDHHSVKTLCRAWRHLLERLPDSSPAQIVYILDKSVELAPESGNRLVRDVRGLGLEFPVARILRRFWRRVRKLVPDTGERQVFVLMLCGVRETNAHTRVLQISHLPLSEQRKEVKRVKDRLVKRLQRADWRCLAGKGIGVMEHILENREMNRDASGIKKETMQ